MRFKKLFAAAGMAAAALSLGACASNLNTRVTRYQQAALIPGQSFYVVPASGTAGPGFYRYASIVSRQLEAQGFKPAGAPNMADMLVRLGYGVDEGVVQGSPDPFFNSPAYGRYGPYGYNPYDPFSNGYGSPYYDPRWGIYYNRAYSSPYSNYPFYYGWNGGFPYGGYGAYGSPYGDYGRFQPYILYTSTLNMDIVQRSNNAPLFEGHARARSQTDELDALVPNLIQAMFTGFPGRNGETVKITIPTPRQR